MFLTGKTWADRWFQAGVTGSSPDGGWGSSAPYYLKSKGFFAITGRVFDKLRNGLAHVKVKLSGRGVHKTFRSLRSDAVPGYYSFAVKKKGTYTLTVKRHGKTARTKVHLRHKWNVTEVAF
ncbi:MAG TPA: carboxypeptidase-like regulatory domain-containing protein [Nocardioides sp.]|uniref:carboxypeptidase-like regulatory domain-containing protein n=1 Tax=Nocardioides sp. TaxID=35761 RepID=UPI002E34D033|nr:carboxypeptidase-like regulatory domain-containing protein [Nocardioides sp.]HEX3931825.1 carboxypeptidase-like regulatory domain-containing protein [Nocardioides sp.]